MKHASAAAKAAAKATATTGEAPSTALATVQTPATVTPSQSVHAPLRVEFDKDGETVKPFAKEVLPQQIGEFIVDRMSSAEKSANQAAWALYRAKSVGETFYANTLISINTGTLSPSAIANLKSVAERVIPFKLSYGVRAPLSLLKDVVAAVCDKDNTPKRTPEAVAVLEALKLENVTQRALRDIRKGFDKSGNPIAKALPAPKVGEASQTPAQAPAAPAVAGIAAEVQAERKAGEAAAAEAAAQPTVQAPVAGKSVDPAKDARDKEFAAKVSFPFRSILGFVREKSVVGEERDIIVGHLRELATLLSLTVS